MANVKHPDESNEAKSGFVDVQTKNGHTMSIFVLSTKDFDELKPREDDYHRVATMIDNMQDNTAPILNTQYATYNSIG